jgi:hypothetical protein
MQISLKAVGYYKCVYRSVCQLYSTYVSQRTLKDTTERKKNVVLHRKLSNYEQ